MNCLTRCTWSDGYSIVSYPSAPLCENDGITPANAVILQAIPSNGGGQINWCTGEISQTITAVIPGPYNAVCTNGFGCYSESNTITIEKLPDFNFLPSGCYDLCSDIPVIIPGVNHLYQNWEWTTMQGVQCIQAFPEQDSCLIYR